MIHPAFRCRLSSLVLLLSVAAACRPQPSEPEPAPGPESPGTSQAALDTPTRFDEVAMVGTVPCSYDYSTVDNCYNELNPERPSIFRELSPAYRPYRASGQPMSLKPATLTGVMQPFPPFEYGGSWSSQPQYADAATAQQVLPANRGSNDGRLFVRGGCRGCAEGSTLFTFRPELLGQDFRYDFATKGTRWVQPPSAMGLHPLIYFNPMATLLPASNNGDFPDALHSTMCEDSVASYNALGHGRNPVACTARYDVGYPLVSGDCYDVSLVYGLKAASTNRWELRSVHLTVFVRAPKSVTAGDIVAPGGVSNWGLWVYPRNPEGEVKSLPTWELPPFKPFNVHETPWNDMSGGSTWTYPGTQNINWRNLFTNHASFKCYTATTVLGKTSYVRDTSPAAPKWCQFFDRQTYTASFKVEDDEDANPDDGGTWNGVSAWPAPGGQERPYALFEPATSGDGRLLVINMDGLYYAYSSEACRAAGWSHFRPISMMPMDPAVNTRYELAKSQVINGTPYPFRDSMGNSIPFGVRNPWAYPWLDREGKNLFFAAKNNPHDGYYARKVVGENLYDGTSYTDTAAGAPANDTDRARFNPDRAPAQAVSVLGAWTHGKAVILDNGLSITDLGGLSGDSYKRTYDLRLYAGADLPVAPTGSSQIFSFENQLNHFDAMRPTLPFDVVWNVQSNTQRNSQVAFDDYLNKRAFVVSHMNAPIRMDVSPHGAQRAETFPQDGFTPTRDVWAYVRGGGVADFRFTRNPRVQNAATGCSLFGTDGPEAPGSLRLRGGARIEPVALGGVSGKGVWLDGLNDFMDLGYPVAASQRDWLLGIWLDSRQDAMLKPGATVARSLPRTIFFFSDNSWVGLVRGKDSSGAAWHELVLYNGATGASQSVNLGALVEPGRYFHLSLKIFVENNQRKVSVFINGTHVSTSTVASSDAGFDPMWNSMNGWTWMTVSDPGPSTFVPSQTRRPFYGWVDELRIYALAPGDAHHPWTDELVCNQALGTLVDIGPKANEVSHPALTALRAAANRSPVYRTQVCEQMRLGTYSDPADYPAQYGEHLCIDRVHKNPHLEPTLASRCLRASKLQLPVLQANPPRPDTSGNAFCLSCHTGTAPLPGLKLGALTAGSGPRYQDPRRQPMNVPAVMGGVVPPWLTTGINQADGTRTLDPYFDHFRAP
ncbi:hypothetical protein [Myxococcus sp. RHSTA-1-4]|uniref:hypothetical protein n=1 Tax=Myxococcus sp. RHSTA-1-4 TaxID=2874601 RepID=UPI001CBBA8AB|nr:hypothetical protein [Myxococcus sp. RHSTA-1-4]MBZ4415894.1 hypothetical protein [Myxococcus sp. RHSTA-1-4]